MISYTVNSHCDLKIINTSIHIWESFSSKYNSVLWILNDLFQVRILQSFLIRIRPKKKTKLTQ
jgi:hypothetical protein